MAYTPTIWKNGEFPPIDAEHLNKIEQGIANSAPGGFGLGDGGKLLTPEDNLDEVKTNGWYYWVRNAPPKGTLPTSIGQNNYATLIRVWGNGAVCYQECVDMTNGNSQGCLCTRTIYGSNVYPWEWVNPPMNPGVEYRTTERFLGKPVYAYIQPFGACASGESVSKTVSNVNPQHVISAYGSANGLALPFMVGVPGSTDDRNYSINISAAPSGTANILITISCGEQRSFPSADVLAKYTKTTE